MDYKPQFLNKALNLISLVVYKGHIRHHVVVGALLINRQGSLQIFPVSSPHCHIQQRGHQLSQKYIGLSEQRDEKGLHFSVLIFFSFEPALWINREFQPLACLSRVF